MKQLYTTLVFLLLVGTTFGQWTKVNDIPPDFHIVSLTVHNSALYAVSDSNIIFKSSDGLTWEQIAVEGKSTHISVLSFYNNRMYVARLGFGTLFSDDDGRTWQNNFPAIAPVSSFAIKNSVLFAATFGGGVFALNPDTQQWLPFNNSLPDYSVNVQNIISAPNFLLIGAGANGTFYRYDFNNNEWIEGFYFGQLRPGLQIDKLINRGDTLWAVNGNRIIRSDDAGITWTQDRTDTHDGFSRIIAAGATDYYTLTNLIPEGTWIQQRSKSAAVGDSWAVNEELMLTGFSYDIIQFGNKLFMGRHDGLYVKGLNNSLPVHFTSFDIRCAGNGFALTWKTAQESGISRFAVEKSTDGIRFTSMANVPPAGTGTYDFTDHNAAQNSWYRIAAIDQDGSVKYTDVLRASCTNVGSTVELWPNPTRGNFYVNVVSPAASQAIITIYDSKGAMVKQQKETLGQGTNRLTINITPLAAGMYNVLVKANNEQKLIHVVKQ
jgi:photosystem II stability/assembly factor-like uncharacterized protein